MLHCVSYLLHPSNDCHFLLQLAMSGVEHTGRIPVRCREETGRRVIATLRVIIHRELSCLEAEASGSTMKDKEKGEGCVGAQK